MLTPVRVASDVITHSSADFEGDLIITRNIYLSQFVPIYRCLNDSCIVYR